MPDDTVSIIAETVFPMLPELSEDQQDLSLAVFRVLARGQRATHEDIASEAGVSTETIDEFLKDHSGVYHDSQGFVVGYLGLSISGMPHKFQIGEQHLNTWCAWDSLFLPELLDHTALVESKVPGSDEIVRLTVSPDGVERQSPESAVMTVILPDLDRAETLAAVHKDIISSFCHHVHFFPDRKSAESWVQKRPDKYAVISVAEGFELGRRMNRHLHGHALAKRSHTV